MLPKRNRLGAAEVRRTLKEGKTLRTPNLALKHAEGGGSGAAVVVSKKVARTAVRRNTIRRAIYRAIPHPLPPHTSLVFLVQKNSADYTGDIKTLCSKLFS